MHPVAHLPICVCVKICFANKKKEKKRERGEMVFPSQNLLGSLRPFRFNSFCSLWEALVLRLRQRAYRQRSAKVLNLKRSDLILIASQTPRQWLSGHLTGDNLSTHNHERVTTRIVVPLLR